MSNTTACGIFSTYRANPPLDFRNCSAFFFFSFFFSIIITETGSEWILEGFLLPDVPASPQFRNCSALRFECFEVSFKLVLFRPSSPPPESNEGGGRRRRRREGSLMDGWMDGWTASRTDGADANPHSSFISFVNSGFVSSG